jgi:hypothetical protein
MSELIKPSDLQTEAQRLIAEGKMPKLEELLSAVASVRKIYADKIRAAQNQVHAGAEALRS